MTEKTSFPSVIFEFICAAALAAAVPMLLVSSYALEADMTVIMRSGLIFSLLFALTRRSGSRLPLVLLISAFGILVFLWDGADALQSVLMAVRDIGDTILDSFETFSHLETKIPVSEGASCTRVLCALGGLAALAASSSFGKYRGLFWTFILTWPVLGLCMVQNRYETDWRAAAVFAAAWAAMLLSRRSRKEGRGRWQWLIAPAAVFAALAFALAAPLSHDRAFVDSLTPRWQQFISDNSPVRATADGVQFVGIGNRQTLGSESWNSSLESADLTKAGPMGYSQTRIMTVYTDDAGPLYLRGNSFGVYTGTSWEALDDSAYVSTDTDETLWVLNGSKSGEVKLKVARDCSIAYTPINLTSLPEKMIPHRDAYISNPERLTEYSMSVHPADLQAAGRFELPAGYDSFVFQHYLDIPESTRAYLDGTQLAEPRTYSARDGDLYRVSALLAENRTYSRSTPAMPAGEDDFVVWFLSECDTGYCVHYASAAVMMLRYLGIPARYVTGFAVNAAGGNWNQVVRSDAHAWVEYYVEGLGWCIFDPTPADDDSAAVQPADSGSAPKTSVEKEPYARKDTPDEEDTVGMLLPEKEAAHIPAWVIVMLCLIALYLVWYFGVKLVRFIQFHLRDPNRRALAIYRWIVVISRLDGVLPPQGATDIALKARFSRSDLTMEDADEMRRWYDETCERMHIYSEFWRAFAANYILAI